MGLPQPEIVSVGGTMPPRSVRASIFSLFRRRPAKPVSSVSAFVLKMDSVEAPPVVETPRLVAVTPRLAQASDQALDRLRPSPQTSRSQQLEAENTRLRQMVSDLVLETEILRAAVRRKATDLSSLAS